MDTNPHIILNPASAAGKTSRRLKNIIDALERRLRGAYSLYVTRHPRDATDSAKSAIEQGSKLIIAVGGDGTIQEVVNGFSLNTPSVSVVPELGIVCSGTAEDIAKSFNLPVTLHQQVEIACGTRSRRVDVGKVTFVGRDGKLIERFFVNECQQGIAAAVVQRVSPLLKRLGGFFGFGVAAVTTAVQYRSQVMTVKIDDREEITDSFLGVVVANGGFAGGGMNFAPRAAVDDGLLDIILIHGQSVPARLLNFPKIYSGRHINLPWVSYYQGKRISVSSQREVMLEADGELLGYLPCTIEAVPSALRVKSAHAYPVGQ
jgi:YegS/Rv2252/BmrU family lipid kinase